MKKKFEQDPQRTDKHHHQDTHHYEDQHHYKNNHHHQYFDHYNHHKSVPNYHQCPIPISPRVQQLCESKHICRYQKGSHVCKCCLDGIKAKIMDQASRDKNLANRILSSANKATIPYYGSLNPRNYRECCGVVNIAL